MSYFFRFSGTTLLGLAGYPQKWQNWDKRFMTWYESNGFRFPQESEQWDNRRRYTLPRMRPRSLIPTHAYIEWLTTTCNPRLRISIDTKPSHSDPDEEEQPEHEPEIHNHQFMMIFGIKTFFLNYKIINPNHKQHKKHSWFCNVWISRQPPTKYHPTTTIYLPEKCIWASLSVNLPTKFNAKLWLQWLKPSSHVQQQLLLL